MGKIIDDLAASGIYTIVDAHQDLLSRKYCGEGMPDWAVMGEGAAPFPEPMGQQYPLDMTGYPSLSDCYKLMFGIYYMSDKVCKDMQALYDNKDGIQDYFVKFWQAVVSALRGKPGVLGWELLNEPFAGDIYSHPTYLIESGKSDQVNLVPMYERLHDAIRALDDTAVLFFEPAVTDYWSSGFAAGPGGAQWAHRNVYSYHIYCADINSTDIRSRWVCDLSDQYDYNVRIADIKRVGTGGFMTEFGASSDHNMSIGEINVMTDLADQNLQSWTYWQFKYFQDLTTQDSLESFYNSAGVLEYAKVRALSRTYAPAVAGLPSVHAFNSTSLVFSLVYVINEVATAPTEIYLNEPWYYPHGFRVTLDPPSYAAWSHPAPNTVIVTHTKPTLPFNDRKLSVTITPL